MSEIEAEVTRVRDALNRPTLAILDRKWAAVALPILACSFSAQVRWIRVERLHSMVDALLDELRAAGHQVPAGSGKSLCAQWVREQWLFREPGEIEDEQYRLTSHAADALNIVDEMTRERSLLSGSRVTTIMETLSRVAMDANPDREQRVARLNEQIDALTRERDRLADGGEIRDVSESDLLGGFVEVLRNLDGLPGDFKRVEESLTTEHRRVLREFRDEERPIAEVLDGYLTRSQDLLAVTDEGQAFTGAFALLRNKEWQQRLRRDIATILEHPYAATLTVDEQRRIRGTVEVIRTGIEDVLDRRRRLSATLREHIENYDLIRNRELDQVLRGIERELRTWMQTAKPRWTVQVQLIPPALEIDHLRMRLYDPDSERVPEPLTDLTEDAPESLTLEQIRQQGGPSLAELRARLGQAAADARFASAGALFNDLPQGLRRPVEVLGLLHLLGQADAPIGIDREQMEAIRPDGSRRVFLVPTVGLDTTVANNEEGDGDD